MSLFPSLGTILVSIEFLKALLWEMSRNSNLDTDNRASSDVSFMYFFQEWVTDSPFIISPRITFEVSVRLLGGLMALGYSIATILKRSSHIFSDDKVCVKTDWLEQLNRRYVQVWQSLITKSLSSHLTIIYFKCLNHVIAKQNFLPSYLSLVFGNLG